LKVLVLGQLKFAIFAQPCDAGRGGLHLVKALLKGAALLHLLYHQLAQLSLLDFPNWVGWIHSAR